MDFGLLLKEKGYYERKDSEYLHNGHLAVEVKDDNVVIRRKMKVKGVKDEQALVYVIVFNGKVLTESEFRTVLNIMDRWSQ